MSDDWNVKDNIQFGRGGFRCLYAVNLEILRKKLIKAFHSPCLLANEENTKKINKLFGVKE